MNKEIENILQDVDLIKSSNDVHDINFLKQRIEIACKALVGTELQYDKGPWEVFQDGDQVYLASEDFMYRDVTLRVNGNFYNKESKVAYTKKLADQLNEKTHKLELPKIFDPELYNQDQVDNIIESYTRNRKVSWELIKYNSSGIGTSVSLVFSDGKTFDVTNYDIW